MSHESIPEETTVTTEFTALPASFWNELEVRHIEQALVLLSSIKRPDGVTCADIEKPCGSSGIPLHPTHGWPTTPKRFLSF